MTSELQASALPVSSPPRLLKCDLCLCVFYGCEIERACGCDTALTYRCVYAERGGKPNILTYKKKTTDRRGANQLVNQNLLGHSFHGSAHVESVQPVVPVVHTGTQCSTHSKHATFRDKKEVSINVNSFYSEHKS